MRWWWTVGLVACSTSKTIDSTGIPTDADGGDADADADADSDADADADSDADTDTGTPPTPEELAIHDVQNEVVAPGTLVTVEGVVTAPAPTGLYLEEAGGGARSGIWVYLGDKWDGAIDAERGDELRVTGVYQEYYELSEIAVLGVPQGDVTNLGPGAEPAPERVTAGDIAANGEDWESVLVELVDLTVAEPDLGYGEFSVEDGTGEIVVDDQIHRFGPFENGTLNPGFPIALLVGPLNYSFGAFMVEPREAADVVADSSIYDVQQGAVTPGADATVTGVIVTAVGPEGVFVQEAAGGEYSGIYVYLGAKWDKFWGPIAVGDVVDVGGQYLEFYDRSELSVPAATNPGFAVTGSAAVPAPTVLTADLLSDPAAAEPWEGVLVEVDDVEVADPAAIGFEFTVVDAVAPGGAVSVDDALHAYSGYGTLAAGQTFSAIIGPLDIGWSALAIEPRDESDIVP